jgi:hypothetical protein
VFDHHDEAAACRDAAGDGLKRLVLLVDDLAGVADVRDISAADRGGFPPEGEQSLFEAAERRQVILILPLIGWDRPVVVQLQEGQGFVLPVLSYMKFGWPLHKERWHSSSPLALFFLWVRVVSCTRAVQAASRQILHDGNPVVL